MKAEHTWLCYTAEFSWLVLYGMIYFASRRFFGWYKDRAERIAAQEQARAETESQARIEAQRTYVANSEKESAARMAVEAERLTHWRKANDNLDVARMKDQN